MSQLCPKCGGDAESIGANRYECPYCGETFTTRPPAVAQSTADTQSHSNGFVQNPNQQSAPVQPQVYIQYGDDGDDESEKDCSVWLKILCFLIPIVGLILYFVKKDGHPKAADSCLQWTIAGFIVSFLITIF